LINFCIDSYKNLLHEFVESGYQFRDFHNFDPLYADLILRHDIDLDLYKAEVMSNIEKEFGIVSTYFIMVSSPFYNIFEDKNIIHIKNIIKNNHKIGLHYDVEGAGLNENIFKNQLTSLSEMIDMPIDIISFHRPSKNLINDKNKFFGYNHTYMPKYMKEILYISDSRGEWRYGNPLLSHSFNEKKCIQLLIHPIWWIHDHKSKYNPKLIINNFYRDYKIKIKRDISQNIDFIKFEGDS